MPIALSIKIDTKAVTHALSLATKQIPFAVATAVNDLAFQVQRAENAAMLTVFKHPRPFTARSVQVGKATKSDPTATVFVRPEVAKYLQPYETGGLHVLPGKALLAPVDIRLDQYGQLPRSTMAILKARKDIYIGPIQTNSGVVTGVWQRLSVSRSGNQRRRRLGQGGVFDATQGALKLLIRFGNAVEVTKRLHFQDRAKALIQAKATVALTTAIEKALATAR
jgi:hypothetical protein